MNSLHCDYSSHFERVFIISIIFIISFSRRYKKFLFEIEGLKEGLLFSKIGGGEVVEKSGKSRL